MSTANDTQIGGQHYKAKTIQLWDYIAANGLGYFEGNIVKYVSRGLTLAVLVAIERRAGHR